MFKNVKFFPPEDKPVSIALLSGHTAVVEPGGTELDQRFHKDAVAKGCMPLARAEEQAPATPAFDRKARIKETIKEMLAGEDPEDFMGNGQPNKAKLDARLGFGTQRIEVETAFNEIQAEADEEEKQEKEQEKDKEPAEKPDFEEFTRKEMMAWLAEREIAFESDANKATLVKACEAAFEAGAK